MNECEKRRHEFVERMAMIFDGMGLTPLSGRVLGWLLVCEPPEQSAEELAKATGGSKGGISMTTRMLEQMRLIHRVKPRGSRKTYWMVRSGAWSDMMKARGRMLDEWLRIAELGVEAMQDKPENLKQRVREMRDFYTYFQDRLKNMLAEWREYAAGREAADE